jgi:hypothetical protein
LQKSFIIPRSPSPEPTSPPPPPVFEDLEDGEVNHLARVGHEKRELARRMTARLHRGEFVVKEFEALTEDEKSRLARVEFESINVG